MNKKIAVLGCGAIGSSVAADLTKAGYDITVIDQWPAQIEKLKADGLEITLPRRRGQNADQCAAPV